MTREEAIDILDTLLNDGWLAPSLVPVDEAIRTAVEALKGDMYCPSCGVRLVSESEYAEPNADQHVQHVGSVGDVISRADVIATVTKWASGEGGDIIELLESLPLAEPSWIPCSERLPDTHRVKGLWEDGDYMCSDYVLVTGKVECEDCDVWVALYEDDLDGRTYWWSSDISVQEVTAWMPLPQPYETGRSDNK